MLRYLFLVGESARFSDDLDGLGGLGGILHQISQLLGLLGVDRKIPEGGGLRLEDEVVTVGYSGDQLVVFGPSDVQSLPEDSHVTPVAIDGVAAAHREDKRVDQNDHVCVVIDELLEFVLHDYFSFVVEMKGSLTAYPGGVSTSGTPEGVPGRGVIQSKSYT